MSERVSDSTPSKVEAHGIISRCQADPLFFSRHVLGGEQPWARQRDIMLSVRDHARTAVPAGFAVGKTWTAARVALWFLFSFSSSLVITTIRRGESRKRFATTSNRSCSSPYLLSGGLFKCGRCGANMTGLRLTKHAYYVCGSLPYRKGRGCGPGVYVPQQAVEAETIKGLRELLAVCRDPKAFTRQVNKELKALWQSSNGHDPKAAAKAAAVEAKIANIRRAVEDGLTDATWANARLHELLAERDALSATTVAPASKPPQIDPDTVLAYRRDAEKTLAHGTPFECKQVLRAWVQEAKLDPERLEVEIAYRVPPDLFMNGMVAGAYLAANHRLPAPCRTRRWRLPRQGRWTHR